MKYFLLTLMSLSISFIFSQRTITFDDKYQTSFKLPQDFSVKEQTGNYLEAKDNYGVDIHFALIELRNASYNDLKNELLSLENDFKGKGFNPINNVEYVTGINEFSGAKDLYANNSSTREALLFCLQNPNNKNSQILCSIEYPIGQKSFAQNIIYNISAVNKNNSIRDRINTTRNSISNRAGTSNKPILEIKNIWASYDVFKNDKKGMEVHLKFQINGKLNKKCATAAYFYYKGGQPLKDYNSSYNTTSGDVATPLSYFTPAYDECVYNDYKIFIPYSELHINEGKHDLITKVEVFDENLKSLGSSNNLDFTYTSANYNSNNNSNCSMSQTDVDNAYSTISSKMFDNDKVKIARDIFSASKCPTVNQIIPMAKLISFDDKKAEFYKIVYPYLKDQNNFYLVSNTFTFQSSYDKMMKELK